MIGRDIWLEAAHGSGGRMLVLAPSKESSGCILGRIGSGEARAANGITHSHLGASNLRGGSVPRSPPKRRTWLRRFSRIRGIVP